MIHRATFENFKALKDVTVTFDSRFTVLVGPNGCGKSSVLRGIEAAGKVTDGQRDIGALLSASEPLGDAFSGDADNDLVVELECGPDNGPHGGIYLRVNTAKPPHKQPVSTGGFGAGHLLTPIQWGVYNGVGSSRSDFDGASGAPSEFRLGLSPVEFLRLTRDRLAAITITQAKPPRIDSTGYYLPSVLGYLKLRDEYRFDLIIDRFRRLIPNVRRVSVDKTAIQGNVYGEELLFDLTTAPAVRASAMSDGTLYILGILIVICGPSPPKVLLLDDLDHGLHPKAQTKLVESLLELLDQNPDLQIIATSHSPYVLDRLDPDQVRVLRLDDAGRAVVGRLDGHPEFERWAESMSPGEFWGNFYEDWLVRKPEPQPVA